MKPDLYPCMSFEDYRAIDAINISSLRQIAQSPAHLKASRESTWKATDSKILGTQIHAAVLEPDRFTEEFIVQPEEIKIRRGHNWDALKDKYGVENIISVKNWNKIQRIQFAVGQSSCDHLVTDPNNQYEVTIVFELAGVLCKARIDCANFHNEYILDLKSTENASIKKFPKSVESYGYGYQQAFYAIAYHSYMEEWPKRTLILAAETAEPYGVMLYEFSQEYILAARQTIIMWLDQYRRCVEKNEWPCYPDSDPYLFTPENLTYSLNPLFIGELEDERDETEAA